MRKIRKVLVPTDFSENSLVALDHGLDFAARFGSEILLTHVMQSPLYPFGFGAGSQPVIEKELHAAARDHLRKLVEERGKKGVRIEGILRKGHVFEEILRVAKDQEVDLIIVATHGHTGLKHAMLGSIAEKIVRQGPCPVLVVRSP